MARREFLRKSCAGDTALQARLEAQLSQAPAGDSEAQTFIALPESSADDLTIVPDFIQDSVPSKRRSVSLRNTVDADASHTPMKSDAVPIDESHRYRVDGEIARGGMGAILKGTDTHIGRDLAIKVLLQSHKNNPGILRRFYEEAQIAGQLQHPGIAPVYELGTFADERPYFSMKLVNGQTLAKLLENRADTAADRGRFLSIFEQVCQTVGYAHARGVIHRDLKPDNVMVGAFGEVQVMDWGLAKVLDADGDADAESVLADPSTEDSAEATVPNPAYAQTQAGSVLGTLAYMPPEQARGNAANLDERADVFGLGAILCEILTGQPPYSGNNFTQILKNAKRGEMQDSLEKLANCAADAELIEITTQCLATDPADRPKDAVRAFHNITSLPKRVSANPNRPSAMRKFALKRRVAAVDLWFRPEQPSWRLWFWGPP